MSCHHPTPLRRRGPGQHNHQEPSTLFNRAKSSIALSSPFLIYGTRPWKSNSPVISWQEATKERDLRDDRSQDLFREDLSDERYIHAKLMIVDDNQVLIGSANINDRSQMDSRDSELAILVRDTENTGLTTTMNGTPYPHAASFAYTLRLRLFHEHLGEPRLADPISPACWDLWSERIDTNTQAHLWRSTDGSPAPTDKWESRKGKRSGAIQMDLSKTSLTLSMLFFGLQDDFMLFAGNAGWEWSASTGANTFKDGSKTTLRTDSANPNIDKQASELW
ncbi:hypothetical protein HKX48_006385 [Thoreauomyces humboldtii]|nr:hypothetical protein HKX48_006385 [Thoreauomyces humboldtii]